MGMLVDSLMQPAAPALVGPLAALLGESPEALGCGLDLAVPALVGALAMRADHGLIEGLMPAVTAAWGEGDPRARALAALENPRFRQSLLDEGGRLLEAAAGPQAGPISEELARLSGVKVGTAGELLKLAGPLALGAIARTLGGAPTAQALTDLLEAETPALERALPVPLRTALAPLAAEPSPLHGTPAEGAAAAAVSSGRWLPWLLAAVAAVALLVGMQRFGDRAEDAQSAPPAPTPMVTEVPPDAVAVPGATLSLVPGSVAHELARYLASAEPAPRAFRFEPFDAEAGASDTPTQQAARDVAAVLAAYPSAMVRLVGHTNAGEPDLSASRAAAVGNLLQSQGIAADRITSEGRGAAEPIATGDTAEGRTQNRRIMLLVTVK